MERRTLGATGLEVSPLTIGTWQLAGPLTFGGKPDGYPDPGRETVLRTIGALFDRGLNSIDTAEQYADGEGERRVGDAIATNRAEWIVTTKFGCRVGPNETRIDDSSPITILPSLEGSLRRLRTDYVDVLLYHCPPRPEDLTAARDVLERARNAGKARFFGISTDGDLDITRRLAEHGLLDVLQCPANLLAPHGELRQFARDYGAGLQVRGVMAQGRLSGRYFEMGPAFGSEDIRSHWLANERYERFAPLRDALPAGLTMAQAALRWALDQPGTSTVCLGARRLDDYDAAIAAADAPPLDAESIARLDAAAAALGA